MVLYFENSQGEWRKIGEPASKQEAWKIVSRFCADRNFKIYYCRNWTTPEGETYYDVGSHTEFFILKEE